MWHETKGAPWEYRMEVVEGCAAVQMAWAELGEKILDGFSNCPWHNFDKEVICVVKWHLFKFALEKDSFTATMLVP